MTPEELAAKKAEIERSAGTAAAEKCVKMLGIARKYNAPEIAEKAMTEGWAIEQFQQALLERIGTPKQVAKPSADADTSGASEKEAGQFSLMRAVQALASQRPLDGLEREMSDAVGKKLGRVARGVFIPREVLMQPVQRTMAANSYSAGGSWVPTQQMPQNFIELLRNKQVCVAMGAREINDLVGDVSFPRQTSGATVESLAEGATTNASDLGTDDLVATPHRLGAEVVCTRQFLAQTTLDAEMILRDDLTTQAAIKRDSLAIYGTGAAGQPLGLKNVSGINTVTFSAAATWAKALEMEGSVETDNALMGSMGYLTSPAAKAKWKAKSVDTGSGQFIWTPDNTVNGYKAMASNQITDSVAIFGNWSDLMLLQWAGVELIVDPYTLASYGKVKVILDAMFDVILRHPVSFCVSTDSAAQ